MAAKAGLPVVTEAFADRAYTDGGHAGATRAGRSRDHGRRGGRGTVRLHGPVRRGDLPCGQSVGVRARSLCLHGDTPGAVGLARRVRSELEASGVRVEAFSMRALPVGDRALLVELADGEQTAAFHAELLRRRAVGTRRPYGRSCPRPAPYCSTGWTIRPASPRGSTAGRLPSRRAHAGHRRAPGPLRRSRSGGGGGAVGGCRPERWRGSTRRPNSGSPSVVSRPASAISTGCPWPTTCPAGPRPVPPSRPAPSPWRARYTGVYPRSSPGGWQLIGTTDAVLWDPAREPAALLAPGTRVRFRRRR